MKQAEWRWFNRNMGCIEIYSVFKDMYKFYVFNRNMGCIEMYDGDLKGSDGQYV